MSGAKDEAAVKAEFGLGASTQVVTIDESFEATEVVGGVLQKFDAKQRAADAAAAKQAADAGKATALKAKLGLTDQEWEDLKSVV